MAPQFFIIGCGKMGSAMLNGWLSASQESDDKADYIIIDPFSIKQPSQCLMMRRVMCLSVNTRGRQRWL